MQGRVERSRVVGPHHAGLWGLGQLAFYPVSPGPLHSKEAAALNSRAARLLLQATCTLDEEGVGKVEKADVFLCLGHFFGWPVCWCWQEGLAHLQTVYPVLRLGKIIS